MLASLTRPLTSSIPALLTGVVVLASAKISPATALRGGLAMALTTMAGFLFDNIYDLPADRAAGQPTPLTQGLVSISRARWLAGILALCAILLEPCRLIGQIDALGHVAGVMVLLLRGTLGALVQERIFSSAGLCSVVLRFSDRGGFCPAYLLFCSWSVCAGPRKPD